MVSLRGADACAAFATQFKLFLDPDRKRERRVPLRDGH
jgi:hypothetical protein